MNGNAWQSQPIVYTSLIYINFNSQLGGNFYFWQSTQATKRIAHQSLANHKSLGIESAIDSHSYQKKFLGYAI
jgi:hypothetical protein